MRSRKRRLDSRKRIAGRITVRRQMSMTETAFTLVKMIRFKMELSTSQISMRDLTVVRMKVVDVSSRLSYAAYGKHLATDDFACEPFDQSPLAAEMAARRRTFTDVAFVVDRDKDVSLWKLVYAVQASVYVGFRVMDEIPYYYEQDGVITSTWSLLHEHTFYRIFKSISRTWLWSVTLATSSHVEHRI